MPQNKGRLQRDRCRLVLGNEARCIVPSWASRGNKSLICVARPLASQLFATTHLFDDRASVVLSVRVEFDALSHRSSCHPKRSEPGKGLLARSLKGRGTESKRGPVICQVRLPCD